MEKDSIVVEETKNYDEELDGNMELPFTQTITYDSPLKIPKEFSTQQNHLFKRKTTNISGISGSKKSEFRELRKRMSNRNDKKTWVQRLDWWLLRITRYIAMCIDMILPKKMNPIDQETSETLWSARIRKHLLDKGKHKRRMIYLAVLLSISFGLVFVITSVPWKSYTAADVIDQFYVDNNDGPLLIVHNMLIPRFLNPVSDPSDVIRLKNITTNPFSKITKKDLEFGYKEVKVQYKYNVNISFSVVHDELKADSKEKTLSCLCAAHIGIPLNIIYIHGNGILDEPTMTLGTKELRLSPRIKNTNLYYNSTIFGDPKMPMSKKTGIPPDEGFQITYPKSIAYRYLTVDGFKSKEAYSMHSACIVFCCELATKETLVGPPTKGGILTHKDGNVKYFGIL